MADRFQLLFSAMAPSIEEQLREQKLSLDLPPFSRILLQQDADDVSRLYVRGLLTEAESDRACKRLMKRLSKHVRPIEPAAGEVQP